MDRVELTLTLDAKSEKPLQAQVFDQVREIILDGQIKAGMALPPSRLLAERLRVSRNTVMLAYERLAAEGYVRARGTAGLFVEPISPDSLLLIQQGSRSLTNGPVRQQNALKCKQFQILVLWKGQMSAGLLYQPFCRGSGACA